MTLADESFFENKEKRKIKFVWIIFSILINDELATRTYMDRTYSTVSKTKLFLPSLYSSFRFILFYR